MQLKRVLLSQKRRTGWAYRAPRHATALVAIAATWVTGYASARERRLEEILTSCRPDVMRFCDRFTGRSDMDAAMFCLRDNFKGLRVECRRVMPTAAERNVGPKKRGVNNVPILHRE
ncbi:hypothetical protein DXU07_08920 [Bradyrhizobium elkanii]|nr:hypothetical protein [Bradyrhizobium elkanii]NWL72291.1 hypothetical protein [Bradyrhizobium elkanii]QOZ15383.1 hypothetical protein XI02_10425 [Bradyrhizobium sp. CCBAU 21365]RYM27000.1 hypothetical protein EWH13_15735 [Bradyrhizobium elkanii]